MGVGAGRRWFLLSALAALGLHALLLFGVDGLQAGADLKPHLRLIQETAREPGLHNVYAPAYHAIGAVLAPVVGLAVFPRVFALAAAAALIAGFRFFQRAAGLPDAAAVLFTWSPYLFALSWCVPKIEAAGYALAFVGFGLLLQRRYKALAGVLVASFCVHTAAGLFLGLCGGILALALRDGRALWALAAGSLVSAPLFAAHLAAGCSAAQAFLFSQGDYLRAGARAGLLTRLGTAMTLANPIAVAAALMGARSLWRERRPLAVLCLAIAGLYANELWLAPFGARTTLDVIRGLTILAFPVAVSAACWLADRSPHTPAVAAACVAWALMSAFTAVPKSCWVAPIDLQEIGSLRVERCTFRWKLSQSRQPRAGQSTGLPRAASSPRM